MEQLVANHRALLGFLERRLGSPADAEDLLQEAFVKGIDRAAPLRDDESAIAWFYRALRNAVIDRRAAAARRLAPSTPSRTTSRTRAFLRRT